MVAQDKADITSVFIIETLDPHEKVQLTGIERAETTSNQTDMQCLRSMSLILYRTYLIHPCRKGKVMQCLRS